MINFSGTPFEKIDYPFCHSFGTDTEMINNENKLIERHDICFKIP